MFIAPGVDVDEVCARRGQAWRDAIARHGGFSDPVHGWNVRHVEDDGKVVSDYVAKVEGIDSWTVGDELARDDLKSRGGVKPFELLQRAVAGDPAAARLWAVYESSTASRVRIQWSHGLRALLEVEEISDEEAAAVESDEEMIAHAVVDRQTWHGLLNGGRVGHLLDAVENLVRWGERWPPGLPSCIVRPGASRGSQRSGTLDAPSRAGGVL